MIPHDQFLARQAEARDRLARLETAIQAQVNTQTMLARAADIAADGTVAGAGAAGRTLASFGSWLGSGAKWMWDHAPFHDEVVAIAQDAWNRATAELASRSSAFRDLQGQLRSIESDPSSFAKNLWNQRAQANANRDITKPHFESPRGTVQFDGADWTEARSLPEELIYKASRDTVAASVAQAQVGPDGAHASDPELTFLYLDVGRWGGVPADGTRCRRDFGIFAGRTAVLCEYGTGIHGGGLGGTIPDSRTDLPAADRAAINRVLGYLGQNGGRVQVVRALASRTVVPDSAVTPNTVYVALGDMHLPVLTNLDMGGAPNVQLGRFEFDDAIYRFGLKGTLAVNQAVVDRAKAYAMARLPSITPGWARDVVSNTIEHLRMGTTGYLGTIGTFDRQTWLSAYRGADIFKDASDDLASFVTSLEAYKGDAAPQSWPVLHLCQLGDMFDLWIGMLCHFLRISADSRSPHFQLDGTWAAPTAPEYVDYWIESTLWSTSHSEGVAKFLSFSGDHTFLYGNHDNYLSPSGHTPPSLSALGGARSASVMVNNHFFAEHGHRPDSFNRDGEVTGWLITQSAFRIPTIRALEPSSRFAQLIAAGNHWLSQPLNNKYCHYVMGHTHVAGLTRVTIESL